MKKQKMASGSTIFRFRSTLAPNNSPNRASRPFSGPGREGIASPSNIC